MSSADLAQAALSLRDLPTDILLLIIPYLSAQDFTALCRSSRDFYYDDEVRFSASYWKDVTRAAYRIPIQPLVVSDGKRWMNLYRRLQIDSKVYCWGQMHGEDLEESEKSGQHLRSRLFPHRLRSTRGETNPGWPRALAEDSSRIIGKVVDVQAGGWSTVLLNSRGSLFLFGMIEGYLLRNRMQPRAEGRPKRLHFPDTFNSTSNESASDCNDPRSAIDHFSTGRAHILAVSDSNYLWTWCDANLQGLRIRFTTISTGGRRLSNGDVEGHITKAVAGWSRSSAYVEGTGIVVWEPVDNARILEDTPENDRAALDTVLVSDTWTVPHTGYSRSSKNRSAAAQDGLKNVGEVVNWILLEHDLFFVTDLGKIFATPLDSEDTFRQPVEITVSNPSSDTIMKAGDVQGSFHSFAILFKDGTVLTGNEETLDNLHSHNTPAQLKRIPSLQQTGVISLAFGDYHYHALHADGTISSHGREPLGQGALGLGELSGHIRGKANLDHDLFLRDRCETTGRRVHFEEEKRAWLEHLVSLTWRPIPEAVAAQELLLDRTSDASDQISEYVEHRLRTWSADLPADDNLPSYFALSVAAAGWHSSALVLVNADQAAAQRSAHRVPVAAAPAASPAAAADAPPGMLARLHRASAAALRWYLGLPAAADSAVAPAMDGDTRWVWAEEAFPRLRLRDNTEMAGEGPLVEWTCPEWRAIEGVEMTLVEAA